MYRETSFIDSFLELAFGSWRTYMLLGAMLVLAAFLLFLFPELLAYMVAGFLLFQGILFFMLAVRARRAQRSAQRWVGFEWQF